MNIIALVKFDLNKQPIEAEWGIQMDDLLQRLYGEFGWGGEKEPENRKEILAEYQSMCDRIQSIFGLEFLDRLNRLRGDLDRGDELTDFRQGMRLGARLALELFTHA